MSLEGGPKVDRIVSSSSLDEQDAFRQMVAFLTVNANSLAPHAAANHTEDLCSVAESLAVTDEDRKAIHDLRFNILGEAVTAIGSPVKFELIMTTPSPSKEIMSPLPSTFQSVISSPSAAQEQVSPHRMTAVKEELPEDAMDTAVSDVVHDRMATKEEVDISVEELNQEAADKKSKKEAKKARKATKKKQKLEDYR